MPKKTSTRQGKVANANKNSSKRDSATLTSDCKPVKDGIVHASEKRYVRRDSTGRFVEVANEHLLRAWNSIHRDSVKERKAN